MISDVDDRLANWAAAVAPGADVVFALRPPVAEQLTIGLYLYAVAHEPSPRTWDRPPHQIRVRYLVTVAAASPRDEHQVLGDLLVAALDDAGLQVETLPWSAAEWGAAGLPPTPAFAVSTLVFVERPLESAPPVLHELDIHAVETIDLVGTVVGPGEIPLVDVRVELVGAGRTTRTNAKGQFRLSAVPAVATERELLLTSKNRRTSVTASQQNDPLLIRLDPPGG